MTQRTSLRTPSFPQVVPAQLCSGMTTIELLPEDIIVGAAEYAMEEDKRGRLIPNDDVYEIISRRRGWK